MARLGINVTHVALMRGEKNHLRPDPVSAVVFSDVGGADGIVCTLNEELHPITERDVRLLKETVKTHLNCQISPSDRMIALMLKYSPDMVTLIPGKKPGSTSGGGLDVLGHAERLGDVIQSVRERDIVVSLLVDPDIHQVKAAAKAGADYVELHLGGYTDTDNLNERMNQLEVVASMAMAASKLDLGVAAGQGVTYQNVSDISAISVIEEINVGRTVFARALWVGMENAVRDMAALVH